MVDISTFLTFFKEQFVPKIPELFAGSRDDGLSQKRIAAEQWRNVWHDYNKFLKELEKSHHSIDARGI